MVRTTTRCGAHVDIAVAMDYDNLYHFAIDEYLEKVCRICAPVLLFYRTSRPQQAGAPHPPELHAVKWGSSRAASSAPLRGTVPSPDRGETESWPRQSRLTGAVQSPSRSTPRRAKHRGNSAAAATGLG